MDRGSARTKPNVMLLMQGSEGYGVIRIFNMLVRKLPARGYKVTVVFLGDGSALKNRWADTDVDLIDLPMALPSPSRGMAGKVTALTKRGLAQLKTARKLAAEIKARGVSVIILRSPLETMLAGLASRISGATAYWLMPNGVSSDYPMDLNRRVYRWLFKTSNLIPVANSRYTDSTLGPGEFERHVIHLGIDLDAFAPGRHTANRKDLGLPEDRPVFGLFARLTEEKGHLVLAEALALIPEEVHVAVCGGPENSPFANRLHKRIEELGLVERFHFYGRQSEVGPYYDVSDVILNTRLDPEPFGQSVIEAMASGKPILAHRAGGPGETIIDGQTGWFIEGPTVEDFVVGIQRALEDRERWSEIGEKAHSHAQAHFSDGRMLDDLDKLIDPA